MIKSYASDINISIISMINRQSKKLFMVKFAKQTHFLWTQD